MEDAFHAKILDCNNIIDEIKTLFETIFDEEDKNNFDQLKKNRAYFISNSSRLLINLYVKNLIETSMVNLNQLKIKYNLKNRNDFINEYEIIPDADINKVTGVCT